jgi:4-methyl-5(b-hydroxyethyl)-thiazole monophosphate biosynthesis
MLLCIVFLGVALVVFVVLADGFEDIEAIAPIDILRRAGVSVTTVALEGDGAVSSHGVRVQADSTLGALGEELRSSGFGELEMLVLPGGGKGTANIKASADLADIVKSAFGEGKLLAAICAAPTALAGLGLLRGKKAVCYPSCRDELEAAGAVYAEGERVVRDGNVVTAEAAGSAVDFSLKLVEVLRGADVAARVAREICL